MCVIMPDVKYTLCAYLKTFYAACNMIYYFL